MAKRIAVKDLRAGSIEATPIEKDWSTGLDFEGYGDGKHGWQFWEAATCQECDKVVVLQSGSGDCLHKHIDSGSECEGYLESSEGPMMNYWYPVDLHWIGSNTEKPEETARRLSDLPLCVVQIDGQYGLALTGGGMDLSWEICEAYTRLGLLPPVHFCDLPAMADRMQPANSVYGAKALARDRYIVAACRESIRVQTLWAKNKLRSLRALSK